ncbi:MAG: hypothetical protein ACLSHO_08210 [Dysosmobacter sp.]
MKKPSNPKTGKKEHNHYRWALTAFVMAVALSGLLSLSSEAILENAGLLLALPDPDAVHWTWHPV